MEITFLSASLSLFFLLSVSLFTYIISKKINFPYTVLLVIVWLLLIPLSKVELFNFINHFELTPDVLFYVFLPILIFESAYNMNYRQLIKNWKSITILAVIWLLISTFIIWWVMFLVFPFLWFNIPFLVCLLFGWLISATDPVAVLSIFKSIWAPRRLTLIFEWESLFNDWTALALFLVILWIILEWSSSIWVWTYLSWIWIFTSMMVWWIAFWALMWVLFSKVIWYVKNNEMVEISLTMVLAHVTFILSEMITEHVFVFWSHLYISWVISTTIAWIVIWNYWRYKITPKVEEHMNKFWEFFAFISNSLIFILMWLILSHINVDFIKFLIPIVAVILIVMVARAISIYLPIWIMNKLKMEEEIPKSWQFLLSWWSLRWALALMMALMIPGIWEEWYEKMLAFQQQVWWNFDFSIKDFIIVITIGSIMFTLFIKATTIWYFMRKSWVSKLHELEEFEYYEWRILAYLKMLEKLNNIYEKAYLNTTEVNDLKVKYEEKLRESVESLKELLEKAWKENWNELIRRALSLHALWIEKQHLKELFKYNEIWEKNFRYILGKINRQIERLETWKPQLKSIADDKIDYDVFQKVVKTFSFQNESYIDKYIRNRTRAIITRKVIKELKKLNEIDFWFDKKTFEEIISLYEKFNQVANEKKDITATKNPNVISSLEAKLADKSLLKLEEGVITDLHEKEIITPKLFIKFMDEIEEEIYSDIKKNVKLV